MDIENILRKYKTDFLAVLFFLLFLPLFLYNLGGFGLTDFDEGWYAEVARNVLVGRDPIIFTFNGAPFTEHPPLGFDLMAISYLFFGVNEFAARFPSAILGWGCLFLTYLIGKNLINRFVGIGGSLMLVSSVWFMFRARSGNLDTIFLFFYLLTFYTAIKMKTNPKWIYGLAVSLAAVFLVKSTIGLSILVPVFIYFALMKVKVSPKQIIKSIALSIICLAPWFIANMQIYGWYYFWHMVNVGLRRGAFTMPNFADLAGQTTFQYLHFGIGKWYKLGAVSLVGLLFFLKKARQLLPVYALLIFLLAGFLTNSKTEIWHLIPIYPFWGLVISAFAYFSVHYFMPKKKTLVPVLTLIPIFALSVYQIYQFRDGIKLFDRGLGGLATVASAAQKLEGKLYLDGHDFLPSAVFYSQKRVQHIRGLGPPQNLLSGFISAATPSSLLLTQKWRLDLDKISQSSYETLAQKEDWMLIKVIK